MFMEHVLLVDDDILIQKALKTALARDQINTTAVTSGNEALLLLKKHSYDTIIVDLIMPDIDGFELIRQIRSNKIFTPIIILSGREEEHNKILGLGLGADDYLTKPFSINLLVSKIKAFYRRSNIYQQSSNSDLILGPFKFCQNNFQIFKNNIPLNLTAKEVIFLKFLLENPNKVFSKEQLYETIWNNTAIDDNTIMVYIKRLRNKIEDNPKEPKFLKTVWGLGYKLEIS
ncbi:response regulator transcription factor [Clostridium saudiense]|nr:response regulator transcription factor [Clostridium saudiense]